MVTLLALCFVLSGFAALAYQTAWTRQFALVFGTSELAVATVLAAYMGGLAFGAWLAERWLDRIREPVLMYALLELGIGASALFVVPALLFASEALLHAVFGGAPSPPDSEQVGLSLFYLGSAFVALAIPTTLMGATLPLLARYAVARDEQIGRRIGALYAANTAGAVVGALATAFWLLPELGLTRTVWAAAVVNIFVFLFAAVAARHAKPGSPRAWETMGLTSPPPAAASRAKARAAPRARFARPPSAAWVLPLMLASGAVSFFSEVLWTRMLSHLLGSSIYAFGVMVASFLAGIAVGGAAGALLARDRRTASIWLAVAQLACAAAAAGAYIGLQTMLPEKAGLAGNAFFGVLLLLPMTLAIGVTYPLAVRVLAEQADDAAPASARVYAWNTVGAIVGSLAAGFVVIPALRYEGAAQAGVIASAALAVLAAFALVQLPRAFVAAITVGALLAGVLFQPVRPDRLLVTSPLNVDSHGRIVHYDVGRSASVVVLEQDGGLALRTNGLPEALMEMPGSPPRFSGEFWLSPLAVIARPRTDRMLVVGYGGGVIIEGIPPSVGSIDVIELEPKVIEANRATRALRKRDPLADPRLNVVTNDARGALLLTDRTYDAIVSQPSHPWTAGASHLYTREFMQQALSHLNEGGVFVQWMNVSFVDESLLRSLTATLIDVFGETRIYRPDPNTLVFLASTRPLELERTVAAAGMPLRLSPALYSRAGINVVEDLVAALAADATGARELAEGAALLTDDDNRMATSSVYELGRGLTAESAGRILAEYDPLQRPESWLYDEMRDTLDFPYIARRIAGFTTIDPSSSDRVLRMSRALDRTPEGMYARAVALSVTRLGPQAEQLIREALALNPDSTLLRYQFLRPSLGQIGRDAAPADVMAEAARLEGVPAVLLQATRLAAQGDWQAVARLDDELAAARWTDPWNFEALQLRAEWRARVANPELRRRAGEEALVLIDRALVVSPTLALFGLRARCAIAAERPDVLLESIWSFGHLTWLTTAGLESRQRAAARSNIEGLIRLLDGSDVTSRADPRRLKEVREALRSYLTRLGSG